MARDPVCHMQLDEHEARSKGLTSMYQGRAYAFCSTTCKQQFDQSPQRYAGAVEGPAAARDLLEELRERIERLERRVGTLEARIEELEEAHAGGI